MSEGMLANKKGILAQKIARLEEAAQAKSASQESGETHDNKSAPARSARASRLSISKFQLDLFKKESDGRFTSYPLQPGSEFPTFLTRIPIFQPIKRGRKKAELDADNAMPFITSWGRGRKHGPPLTVYDEDTLMAIARLRKTRLMGRPHNMPIPLSAVQSATQASGDDVAVHVLACSLSDIQLELCDSDGGANLQLRLASIKRLGATVMEFDRETNGKLGYRGTQVKIVDIAWDVYEHDAVLLIQFSPLMAAWLESEYTYIDWGVRKQLSDTGKALHRFFSAQPKQYAIGCEKLSQTIGYQRHYRYFMSDLRTTMQKLTDIGWLASWDISGTGRKIPHKLTLTR